jgi:phage terminase large subunit GpA-like protein
VASSDPLDHESRAVAGDGWTLGLALPPRLSVSQWADAKRVIARGTGPEPGRWRTDRTPWLREPMDSVVDPDGRITVLKFSSQTAKTEALINIASYFVDQDPAPQLFVLPTLELADSFSTKRFTPTVEETPALISRIGRTSARDSSTTIREKSYPGGDLVFAGANSPASLASRPRRAVLFDEIDKYKLNIGHDGDPIEQGIQRTQNFWNAKIVLASTPTIAGLSLIDDWFAKSSQAEFHVPCHNCGAEQALVWETDHGGGDKERRIIWEAGRPETARYVCVHCTEFLDDRQIQLAVQHGRWLHRHPERVKVRGYAYNTIGSPWVTLAQLAELWEAAEGRPEKEQTFYNLKLGLSYNPTKEAQTTVDQLLERREDYGPEKLPEGVLIVTAFVDVQRDRFEVSYVGFGADEEKWVVDHQVMPGDPTDPQAWEALDEALLGRTFPHALGGEIALEAVGVDAGYLQQRVMEFVRQRKAQFRSFFAVKGMPGFGRPLWRESEEKFKLGAKLYLSGIDDGKTVTYSELAVVMPRVRIHLPRHVQRGYLEQLISERIKIEYRAGRPQPSWHLPSGRRNEALDCFVGCQAVRCAVSVDLDARRAQLAGTSKTMDFAALAGLFKR